MKTNYPTKEELRQTFEIIDGELWRKAFISCDGRQYLPKKFINKTNDTDGYCVIGFRGRMIKYHTVIWILHNGDIAKGMVIDHIDGNRINNDINNLRVVTDIENNQNTYKHRSGRLAGSCFNKRNKKWCSYITINKKRIYLGYFNTNQEAHEMYLKMKLLNSIK